MSGDGGPSAALDVLGADRRARTPGTDRQELRADVLLLVAEVERLRAMPRVAPEACPGLLVYVDGEGGPIGEVAKVSRLTIVVRLDAGLRMVRGSGVDPCEPAYVQALRTKLGQSETERMAAMGEATRERFRADKAEAALASVRAYAETLTRAANSLLAGPEREKLEALWAEATRETPPADSPPSPLPTCATCGGPIACLGRYEGAEEFAWACHRCCGHGNEDGFCVQLADLPSSITQMAEQAEEDE